MTEATTRTGLSEETRRRIETFSGTGECPSCFVDINLNKVMVNEIVQCPECGEDLEVLGHEGDQLKLDIAPGEDEDIGE